MITKNPTGEALLGQISRILDVLENFEKHSLYALVKENEDDYDDYDDESCDCNRCGCCADDDDFSNYDSDVYENYHFYVEAEDQTHLDENLDREPSDIHVLDLFIDYLTKGIERDEASLSKFRNHRPSKLEKSVLGEAIADLRQAISQSNILKQALLELMLKKG